MPPKKNHRIGRRVGVSTVVAISALATGISVAGAASNTGLTPTKAPTSMSGVSHAGDRGRFGDLGVVGSVTAVSATSITVRDPGGVVATYGISGSTVVRKDGAAATATSLAVGENVAIMVSSVGSKTAATIVIVPPGAPVGDAPDGVVTNVSSTSITLRHADGTSSTYAIDPSTTVNEGRARAAASALAVGERVQVRPSTASATTAAAIEIDLAHVAGTVVSVTGDTITVSDRQGFYRTIQVGDTTTYVKAGASAALGDVTTGTVIGAEGTIGADHTTLEAVTVDIGLAPTMGGAPGAPGWAPGAPNAAQPVGPGMDMMAH